MFNASLNDFNEGEGIFWKSIEGEINFKRMKRCIF